MTSLAIHLVVPGSLDQRTGGYIYDARMMAGLQRRGWCVTVHNLAGEFPDPDDRARASLTRTLAALPDRARVLIDGLAMAGFPEPVCAHSRRLRILALVHHPCADETGLDQRQRNRFATLEREALGACGGVLVTSEFTASRMEAFGVHQARVRAVRPGTDPALPAKGGRREDPPGLLCVASVIPRKGQDVLVRALARLREVRWSCVCAGSLTRDPAYARDVQQQACEAGLADRISFVGECEPDALNALYDSSSVFVLPSHYEGFGIALTEALSRGLPVISTTGGAIPYTVPADAGLLVPPGDDEALAEALGELLPDVRRGDSRNSALARRTALAVAARRHAASLPSWDQAAAAFAEAMLDLIPDDFSRDV